MDNKLKISIVVAVAAAIILSVSFLSLALPRTVQTVEAESTYTEHTSIGVTAELSSNALYGSNATIDYPSVIYSNITKNLSFSQTYLYSSTNFTAFNFVLDTTITIVSHNPSWTKIIYENTTTTAMKNNWPFIVTIPVNMSYVEELATTINTQLGYASQFPSVTVQVNTTGHPGELSTISGSLSIIVVPHQYLLSYYNGSFSGTITKNVNVPAPFSIPLNPIISYIMIVTGAAILLFPLYIVTPRKRDPFEMFLKRINKDALINVTRGPNENAIQVEDPEDIIKMSNLLETPIFVLREKSMIFTEKGDKQYYTVINK